MREIILTKKIKSGTIIRAIGLLLFFVTVFAKANAMRAAPHFFTGHQLVFANDFRLGKEGADFQGNKNFLKDEKYFSK